MLSKIGKGIEFVVEYLIFASRWMQAPIYIGLIAASIIYLYKFVEEVTVMVRNAEVFTEIQMMLGILGLIDISMVMNLVVIVVIGGYSIFTSKIDFDDKEDRPQWIDHLDADRLKVKLSTSLASISGVHLLKTFIDIHSETGSKEMTALRFEIIIHLVFIISALVLAWIVKILETKAEALDARR
jgi:uncharacterized protein (TIGR00645 family)